MNILNPLSWFKKSNTTINISCVAKTILSDLDISNHNQWENRFWSLDYRRLEHKKKNYELVMYSDGTLHLSGQRFSFSPEQQKELYDAAYKMWKKKELLEEERLANERNKLLLKSFPNCH